MFTVFCDLQYWTMDRSLEKPEILSIMHHHQNPLNIDLDKLFPNYALIWQQLSVSQIGILEVYLYISQKSTWLWQLVLGLP
jgi:hypothetical protein